MEERVGPTYKYRKLPLFLPVYFIFAILYFFVVYSFSEFSYRTFAETIIMTIFITTAPMLSVFYLKIVKIKEFSKLFLQYLYFLIGSKVVIYILMYTYLEGEEWFGAILLLFSLFVYYLFSLFLSFIYYRLKIKKSISKHATFA